MQLSALTLALGRFVSELQRRKVIRVGAGYVIAGWIILQVAMALETSLNLPGWFDTIVVSFLALGFPVALIAAWLFDFTSEGIKRTVTPGDGALLKPQTTDWILIGTLVVVACIALVQAVMPREATQAPVATTATADAPKATPEPPALGDKSIAVLPFANLSPDKENEYFADGLTEELLNLLAKIGDLKVISRTSSFAFKGKNTPLPEIARQLGVRHVLEGSVRAQGEDLRVTAQLIDVQTDTHLWSKTYERKVKAIFGLQDEIAGSIARALDIEVTIASRDRNPPTRNVEAYRLYLEGRALYRERDEPSFDRALGYLKAAVAKDPAFAEAYAVLAGLQFTSAGFNRGSYAKHAPLALEAAQTAVRLDPKVKIAYGVLGGLDRLELKWASGIANGERAVALHPSDATARTLLGISQIALGRIDAASASFEDGERLDPMADSPRLWSMAAAMIRGDEVEATQRAGHVVALPRSIARYGHFVLAAYAYDRGDGKSAESHYRKSLRPVDKARPVTDAISKALLSPKSREAALRAIVTEFNSASDFDFRLPLIILRAEDTLLELANKGIDTGYTAAIPVTLAHFWSPRFASVRGDPRFKDLVRKAGLVDYWKKHGWPDRCRAKGEDDFECN